jgi:hypothetical protein
VENEDLLQFAKEHPGARLDANGMLTMPEAITSYWDCDRCGIITAKSATLPQCNQCAGTVLRLQGTALQYATGPTLRECAWGRRFARSRNTPELLPKELVQILLAHLTGSDTVDSHDRNANRRAALCDERVFTAHRIERVDRQGVVPSTIKVKLFVVTEADRSATTVMLADDY